MSENSVEALLEEARLTAAIPPPAERQRLREAAGLSRAQVASAVGVGRSTVANWETGVSDPQPPARLPYLRLLKGLVEIYPTAPGPAPAPVPGPATTSAPAPAAVDPEPVVPVPAFTGHDTLRGPDGLAAEGDPGPCVRCGATTTFRFTDGHPLHAEAFCGPAAPPNAVPATTVPGPLVPGVPNVPAPAAASPTPAPVPARPQRRARPVARARPMAPPAPAGPDRRP